MLENLGQAQVLPYLRGLARKGVEFDLISFELPNASDAAISELQHSLAVEGIRWQPLRRARDPRLRTKLRESTRGVVQALVSALSRRPVIIHGRSYLPTAVGDLVASAVPRARLIFDCRGMIGDEYVDAGYWTQNRLEYRLVKRYEQRVFRRAEGVVVLTQALKKLAIEQRWLGQDVAIEAIPCCVDLERFHFDAAGRAEKRKELGLEDRLVIVYSGSLGGWYRERELARFAGVVKQRAGDVVFLLLTHQSPDGLLDALAQEGLSGAAVVVRRVAPKEMAQYLSAGDIALSFIKSCFSKLGSSPTKVAEYLACGLPVVLNGDIGDQAELANEPNACVVLKTFETGELVDAADHALRLAQLPLGVRESNGRRVAEQRFGLERVGVARYERLYRHVANR